MELNKLQLDALKEIGTVGAGNAATSLSKMISKRVDITVPNARVVPIEKVPELVGGQEESRCSAFGGDRDPDSRFIGTSGLITAVIFEVNADVNGVIMVLFSMEEAKKLSALLLSKPFEEVSVLDEMGISALREVGNILTGTYLNSLAAITNLKITHSIPNYASDMLISVLDGILIKLSLEAEDAIVVETEFEIEEKLVRGFILFIPEPEGLQAILKTLGLSGKD